MPAIELRKLVDGTGDAAFVLSPDGIVVAWNTSAASMFGLTADEAIGRGCSEILAGLDECGRQCDADCTIRERARKREPIRNYDIQLVAHGRHQWCNVSVLLIEAGTNSAPFTLHVVRPAELRKRFELLVRDFVVSETSLPDVHVTEILKRRKTPTAEVDLTKRETEILTLLAGGASTAKIAENLFISKATANNHIQHIMKKLSAHTRLEAVRRAEQAGLI